MLLIMFIFLTPFIISAHYGACAGKLSLQVMLYFSLIHLIKEAYVK